MSKATILVGAMLLAAMRVQAQPSAAGGCTDPGTVAAAHRIVDEWKAGYNDGVPQRVSALYTEDATYLTQHFVSGIVQGRPAIEAYVKLGTDAGYKIASLEILSLGCTAEMAYAITRYRSENRGQQAMGVNLVVLRRQGVEWRIVAHEAAVPDPAQAVQHLEIPAR